MDWLLLIVVIIGAIAVVIFTVTRNRKDKKDLVDKLNNDYRKTKDEEGDAETDNIAK